MARIITTDIFVRELKEINPSIEVLGEYIKAKDPILCKCINCGHTWSPIPSNLRKGRGCPKCNKHYIRSEKELINELKIINPNIRIIGKFINTQKSIEVECLVCGHKWNPVVNSLLSQHTGCPECKKKMISKKNMLPREEIVKRMKDKHPEVEIIGEIIDKDTPVKCKCGFCGNIWDAKYSSLKNAAGCPKCMHQERISDKEFKRRVHLMSPNIIIQDKYKKQKEPVHCKCSICGYEWPGIPNNLMLGAGCKQCAIRRNSKAQRKKPEDYVREVSEINDTITITSKYVNGSTKICYHCNICGYDGKCKPFALLRGQGCANCNNRSVSFAECFIAASFSLMLGENKVKRRDRKLISKEIDIYIPSLNLAIEPGSWVWHKNKIRVDNEKQRLCKEKGVRLIIIYSDCYLDKSPLDHDCWIYGEDFTRSKDNITLKRIVNKLFDEVGIGKEITDGDWKTIENIAYISSRNITTTEFIKRVNPSKKGFLILGEFIDSKKPIKCKCLKCDYEWNPLASVLLYNGSACPKCAGVLKKTQEEFEKEVAEKNPSIRIIGEYINRKLSIECECRKCGKRFSRVPANILYGAGCPDCKKKEQIARSRKTPQEFEEEFKMNGDSSIVLLGRYVRTSDKIECQCQKCNHIWDAPPRDLLKGHGCPRCNGVLKKTQEEFEAELCNANPSITTITEYKGMNNPIIAKCKICGCEFETTPSSLIHNRKKCNNYRNHSNV